MRLNPGHLSARERRLEYVVQPRSSDADEDDLVLEHRRIDVRFLVRENLFLGVQQIEERVRRVRPALEILEHRGPAKIDQAPQVVLRAFFRPNRSRRQGHRLAAHVQCRTVYEDAARVGVCRANRRGKSE